MRRIRVRCRLCGRVFSGRKPLGSDGTVFFPHFHRDTNSSLPCGGIFYLGLLVTNKTVSSNDDNIEVRRKR